MSFWRDVIRSKARIIMKIAPLWATVVGVLATGLEVLATDVKVTGLKLEDMWLMMLLGIATGGITMLWIGRRQKTIRQASKSALPTDTQLGSVPKLGEFLLYLFLTKEKRESLSGDLEEEFTTVILPKFGPLRAKLWYWAQVVHSIGPLLARQIVKLLSFSWLLDRVRRWMQS